VSVGSAGWTRRITNVSPGIFGTDAVNVDQLNDLHDDLQAESRRGIAVANAMDVFLPDPGKQFRVNVGGGFYGGESAIGITAAGRINQDIAMYVEPIAKSRDAGIFRPAGIAKKGGGAGIASERLVK
jgi:hypothetical protein